MATGAAPDSRVGLSGGGCWGGRAAGVFAPGRAGGWSAGVWPGVRWVWPQRRRQGGSYVKSGALLHVWTREMFTPSGEGSSSGFAGYAGEEHHTPAPKGLDHSGSLQRNTLFTERYGR